MNSNDELTEESPRFWKKDFSAIDRIVCEKFLVSRNDFSDSSLPEYFVYRCSDSGGSEFCHLAIHVEFLEPSSNQRESLFLLRAHGYHRHALPTHSPLFMFRTDTESAILHLLRAYIYDPDGGRDDGTQCPSGQQTGLPLEDSHVHEISHNNSDAHAKDNSAKATKRRSAMEASRFMQSYSVDDFGVVTEQREANSSGTDSDDDSVIPKRKKPKWGPSKIRPRKITSDTEATPAIKNTETILEETCSETAIRETEPEADGTKTITEEPEASSRSSKRKSALNAHYYMKSCLDSREVEKRKENPGSINKKDLRKEPSRKICSSSSPWEPKRKEAKMNQSRSSGWTFFATFETKAKCEESVAESFGNFCIDHTTRHTETGSMLNQTLRCTKARSTKCPFAIKIFLPRAGSVRVEDGDPNLVRIFIRGRHPSNCPKDQSNTCVDETFEREEMSKVDSTLCPIPQEVLDRIDFYLNKLIEADFLVPKGFKKEICELIVAKWKSGELDDDEESEMDIDIAGGKSSETKFLVTSAHPETEILLEGSSE